MAFVPAVCPQCGGQLQVPDDRDIVKCMYCTVDVVVRQAVRLVTGNTSHFLKLAETARESNNHEEALTYYNKALENDPNNWSAWFGKGASAGWLSRLAEFRFQEMFTCLDNAISHAPPDEVEGIKARAAQTVNSVAIACYQISHEHALKFIALEDTWREYVPRCEAIIVALRRAHDYAPQDQTILENIIHLCKDNIEGIAYNDPYDRNIRKVVHLSDDYERKLRGIMGSYAARLSKLNSSYQPPEAKRQSSGCFVVTATYGDPNHPDVRLLRAFRDSVLMRSEFGRAFCASYYLHGPKLARRIAPSRWARAMSRVMVVKPAVKLARGYIALTRRDD